jgi:1-acyl-sn-glycerol-3-phosphate acyltransferase
VGDLNGWWRFGLVLLGPVLRVLLRIRVVGVDNVPTRGAAVVASNHVSMLDGVVLAYVVAKHRRRMTRFLVAAEFFRKPLFASVLRLYRQIPIRRGERDADALGVAIEAIRSGALAGIFPEGTVNPEPGGGPQRGRSGAARIALAADAPVVPAAIAGTERRWPRSGLRRNHPWRTPVTITFGEPIAPGGDAGSPEDVQEATERIMAGIAALLEPTPARGPDPG